MKRNRIREDSSSHLMDSRSRGVDSLYEEDKPKEPIECTLICPTKNHLLCVSLYPSMYLWRRQKTY